VRCFTLVVGYISANWILNKAVANKIDFETADCAADSPCGIEIVSIEKGKITKKGYRLIRPLRRHFVFSYIHGGFTKLTQTPEVADGGLSKGEPTTRSTAIRRSFLSRIGFNPVHSIAFLNSAAT
jgi:hypothetical protein